MRLEAILAATHEINLKGGNRGFFEGKMIGQLKRVLEGLPVSAIDRPSSRVLVRFSEPVAEADAVRRLRHVFGLQTIFPVHHGGFDLESLWKALAPGLEGLEPASFRVCCQRSDKDFPMKSPEIEREIGHRICELHGWKAQMKGAELEVGIVVDIGGLWWHLEKLQGPGGLPVGSAGRGLTLLSGGIDSPLAAWMMMKRGLQQDFIHFHSAPRTDESSLDKTERLAEILCRYQGTARLFLVPLLEIQEAVVARAPEPLRVLLYRRFMVRIAEEIATEIRAKTLITGESLSQVASQTIENLAAVEAVARRPILRPLIGLTKLEIIDGAKRIDTFDISIEPHSDCCSFLAPQRPATKCSAKRLTKAEAALSVDSLIATALEGVETIRIKPAGWST